MQSLKVLLLICAASTPRADCTPETALDIVSGPAEAGCGMMAQAFVAGTTLGQRMTSEEYLKVVCGAAENGRGAGQEASTSQE